MGRTAFTEQEVRDIKALLAEIAGAEASVQKVLRAKLRTSFGFYVSDFTTDQNAFAASDVDDLVQRGVITLSAEPAIDEGPETRAPMRE
jgi:hypothetical protein